MGWAVGWDSDRQRWRGYGVPAYCDAWAAGCRVEIDRGLDATCNGSECDQPGEDGEDGLGCFDRHDLEVNTFVCSDHTCADVDEANLPPEHPNWVRHLLDDESWQKWRDENPARVAAIAASLTERESG